MLDESDHDMNLQDRYESEQHDLLFDTKVVNYKANNSMGRDDYREERVKRAVKKYGKTLWHYTDINALCGIIGKKEIWFGSAEHMNDREELIGFINDLEKKYMHALIQLIRKKPMMFLGKSRIDCKKNIHIYFAYPKHVMMQHNGIGMHVVDKE